MRCRVVEEVQKRLGTLEEALQAKSKLEGDLAEATRLLGGVQDQLRLLNKGVGHKHEDATAMLATLQVRAVQVAR